MFRRDIRGKTYKVKFWLYGNANDRIGEISTKHVEFVNITYKEIPTISLKIPKKLSNGEKNSIYYNIKPMQHVIMEEYNFKTKKTKYTKFLLKDETTRIDKRSGLKSFTGYGFEYKLKQKTTDLSNKVLQLYPDKVNIGESVLGIFEKETGWKVDYVDEDARYNEEEGMETISKTLYSKYSKANVTSSSILWEADVKTNVKSGVPLYLTIKHLGLKSYNSKGEVLYSQDIENVFDEPLHTNITHVTAKHYSVTGNRYGIQYVFKMADGSTKTVECNFMNVINKKITCDNIVISWETGNVVKLKNIRYVNFESMSTDWYNALTEIQDMFECVFVFDGYNKTISAYHKDNIGKIKPYRLSLNRNIIDVEVKADSEYISALKVTSDNVSITSENIYGGNIIYDYSYYIDNKIMDGNLLLHWKRYQEYIKVKQEEWRLLKNNYMELTQRVTQVDSEITSLNYRIKNMTNLLTAYIASGDEARQKSLKEEINELQARVESLLSLRADYNKEMDKTSDSMASISTEIKRENATDSQGKIFTKQDLSDLDDMYVEDEYSDSYYSTAYGLYNNALKELEDRIKPLYNFTMNVPNLMKFTNHPQGWDNIISIGDIYYVEGEELVNEIKQDFVRLVSYKIAFDDYGNVIVSEITLSNKDEKISTTKHISNVGRKTSEVSSKVSSWQQVINDAYTSNNFVKTLINGKLDLIATSVAGRGMRNYIDISDCGIFVIDQDDQNRQIYMGSSMIAISTDGFKTCKTAIDADGITADLLMGRILLGEKLCVSGENGLFYIGDSEDGMSFGIYIYNSLNNGRTLKIFLGLEKDKSTGLMVAKLKLIGKNGKMMLTEDGLQQSIPVYSTMQNISNGYNVNIYFDLPDEMTDIRKAPLNLRLHKWRGLARNTSSGGYASSSSGATTNNGGGYASSTGGGGSTTTSNLNFTNNPISYVPLLGDMPSSSKALQTLWYDHRHVVPADSLNHTHSIPSHSHSFSVPAHSHNISMSFSVPNHTHDLIHGIYESNDMPSNVRIWVNHVLVAQNVYTNVLGLNVAKNLHAGANLIEIISDSKGIVDFNMLVTGFLVW